MDIERVLDRLKAKRRIFTSEADFQFALAWEIQLEYPEAQIRLEYIPFEIDRRMHVDICVFLDDEIIPIELKHFSAIVTVVDSTGVYSLKNQGAQDLSRYDFIKDIVRIEKLMRESSRIREGYVIALTNDSSIWRSTSTSGKITCDYLFKIHDGSTLDGVRKWADHTGGTSKGREAELPLEYTHKISWHDYSDFPDVRNGKFRYTCVKVSKNV